MKKAIKILLFSFMIGTALFALNMSAQAASKVAINDTNFAWAVKKYAKKSGHQQGRISFRKRS